MSLSTIASIGNNEEVGFSSYIAPSETDVVNKAHVIEELEEVSHIQGKKLSLKPSSVKKAAKPRLTHSSEALKLSELKRKSFFRRIFSASEASATSDKDEHLLNLAGSVISKFDDAAFRGQIPIFKELIIKSIDEYIEESKASTHWEVKTMCKAIKLLKTALKKDKPLTPLLITGLISKQDEIAVIAKYAPHSLLVISVNTFIKHFEVIVNEASSKIISNIETEGIFRIAGTRSSQSQLILDCILDRNSHCIGVDVSDWCDILKALALEYLFLEEAEILPTNGVEELTKPMRKIEKLLKKAVKHASVNKMNKGNIEKVTPDIVRVLHKFKLTYFDIEGYETSGLLDAALTQRKSKME
jgi:hypothetical protein